MKRKLHQVGLLGIGLFAAVACAQQTDAEPEAEVASGWDAESATNEAASTHLWIVNNALRVLGKHSASDPIAARATRILNDEGCRTQWQRGLLDADFKAQYNDGRRDLSVGASDLEVGLSGATWESHFYDPDTGKNYKGTPKTALTESKAHLAAAFENANSVLLHSGTTDQKLTACYEYGVALHYFTDLTQPMHATNFTALQKPKKLHSNLEVYSMEVQARFPLENISALPSGELDAFVIATARASKALWEPGVAAIVGAYGRNHWRDPIHCGLLSRPGWRFLADQIIDYRNCWENDAEVDAMVGRSLRQAQDATAQFIYLATSKLAPPAADVSR